MPKERSINPAAAQRKADKQKEIAKSKKNVQQQRNEKLARRNPNRVQRQIDELKELESRGGLRPKDKETLTQLERDLNGIRRARDALGDAAPKFPSHERRDPRPTGGLGARQEQQERRQQLGKRRRGTDNTTATHDHADHQDYHHHSSSGEDTDPEARDLPMPRDTPPPLPRPRRAPFVDPQIGPDGVRIPHALPAKLPPPAPAQTVYSSAPQLRDLKKEAAKFVPSAVAQQKRRVKGEGRLLEPEEIAKLEQAGYYAAEQAAEAAGQESELKRVQTQVRAGPGAGADLDQEFERFEREMGNNYPTGEEDGVRRNVQMEEVDDDGD